MSLLSYCLFYMILDVDYQFLIHNEDEMDKGPICKFIGTKAESERIRHAYHLMFLPIVLIWTLSSYLRCVESLASIFWHFLLIEVHSRPPIPSPPLPNPRPKWKQQKSSIDQQIPHFINTENFSYGSIKKKEKNKNTESYIYLELFRVFKIRWSIVQKAVDQPTQVVLELGIQLSSFSFAVYCHLR